MLFHPSLIIYKLYSSASGSRDTRSLDTDEDIRMASAHAQSPRAASTRRGSGSGTRRRPVAVGDIRYLSNRRVYYRRSRYSRRTTTTTTTTLPYDVTTDTDY